MSRLSELPPDILELLSGSLDGALSPEERAALEAHLQRDPTLREALLALREARAGLGMLPRLRTPRNFTLTPEMVGRRAGRLAYPSLRLATALAALGFVLTFGLDAYAVRFAALPAALLASAPAEEAPVEAPPEAAAEMMLESAAAPQALSTPVESDEVTGRSAADAIPTATAQATTEPSFKAGAVGEEPPAAPSPVTPDVEDFEQAPTAAPTATLEEADVDQAPPATLVETEAEAKEPEAAEAEARLPLLQDSAFARMVVRAQPLRLAWTVLGMLTVVLGLLSVWARSRR